jgi:predicted secreted protein
MTASVGRNITLVLGTPPAPIAGVKEKSATFSGEPIDISSDDDGGWRTLLAVPGQKQVELKVSGVTKDRKLLADWFAGATTKAIALTYEDGAKIAGEFFLSEYADKGNFKDATSFDATLMSSGEITYTAAEAG